MSFADWKKRSKVYEGFEHNIPWHSCDLETVCQAAYKAGERDGRKQVEQIAKQAIELRKAWEQHDKKEAINA